jgi:electron transfer flavoprotein beta subunit
VLRTALAAGADRAILVRTDAALQPLAVARLLAAIVRREIPQLVILGKQAIDDDCNQTGQRLAAMLGWPQATFASKVRVEGDSLLTVARDVDGGIETVQLALPAIVTADLRLNEPRFVSLPNLMKSKKKRLDVVPAETLGADLSPRWTTLAVDPPPQRQPGVLVKDAAELVHRLRHEANVI